VPWGNLRGLRGHFPNRNRAATRLLQLAMNNPVSRAGTKTLTNRHRCRVRRKRQRLPSCLLIENASAPAARLRPARHAPRHFRSRLATNQALREKPGRSLLGRYVCTPRRIRLLERTLQRVGLRWKPLTEARFQLVPGRFIIFAILAHRAVCLTGFMTGVREMSTPAGKRRSSSFSKSSAAASNSERKRWYTSMPPAAVPVSRASNSFTRSSSPKCERIPARVPVTSVFHGARRWACSAGPRASAKIP